MYKHHGVKGEKNAHVQTSLLFSKCQPLEQGITQSSVHDGSDGAKPRTALFTDTQ